MWLKLDENLADHKKFVGIDPRAGWLHIHGLCYSGRYLMDGNVPANVARTLAYKVDPQGSLDGEEPQLLRILVQRGVWDRRGDDYRIHDYLDYNPSRRKVLADRKAARVRRQKARTNRVLATKTVARTSPERRASIGRKNPAIDPTRPDVVSTSIGSSLTESLGERESEGKGGTVGRLVDMFRALPGNGAVPRDGPVIAGLVGKYGAAHVEAKIRVLDLSIAAAVNPLQYLAGACRRPLAGTLEDEKTQTMRELAQFRAEGRLT